MTIMTLPLTLHPKHEPLPELSVKMECPCDKWSLEVSVSIDPAKVKGLLLRHRKECIVFAAESFGAMVPTQRGATWN